MFGSGWFLQIRPENGQKRVILGLNREARLNNRAEKDRSTTPLCFASDLTDPIFSFNTKIPLAGGLTKPFVFFFQ